MPSVSVIIPTYDAAGFIGGAWRSLLAQTEGDFEAIFVDDCSTDGSADIAAGFAAADPRARAIRLETNGGPGGARNVGIAAATGEWIAVLDADDTFEPTRLARLRQAGAAHDGDIVLDNLLIIDPVTMRPIRTGFDETGPARPLDGREYLRNVQTGRNTFDWGFLKPFMRRGFLERSGLRYRPEMRFGEDVIFMLEAIMADARLVLVPDPLYRYTSQYSLASRRHSQTTRTTNNYPALIAASRSVRLAASDAPREIRTLLASREESLRELSLASAFRDAVRARDPAAIARCMTNPVRLVRAVHTWRSRHRKQREIEARFAARGTAWANEAGQNA